MRARLDLGKRPVRFGVGFEWKHDHGACKNWRWWRERLPVVAMALPYTESLTKKTVTKGEHTQHVYHVNIFASHIRWKPFEIPR
jgi:hypothetical protein